MPIKKIRCITVITKGNVTIDKEKYKCFVGNDEVALTTKEFDVLYLIMKK